MSKSALTEIALIEHIRGLAGAKGIGDDCFNFRPPRNRDLLFTVDFMIEDVHFLRSTAADVVGHRALARGLSDIAAMGGDPHFCLVALSTAPWVNKKWIDRFYQGLMKLARVTKTNLAGGDLSRAQKTVCTVTVCGSVAAGKALRRSGARPGDRVFVSGPLGRGWIGNPRPQPRLEIGRKLLGRASAAMDLSDGLSIDLHRLAKESKVAARIDHVPIAQGATIESALHGGEDYELLFTVRPGTRPPRGSILIGEIVRGKTGAVHFDGKPLPPLGYDHFRKIT